MWFSDWEDRAIIVLFSSRNVSRSFQGNVCSWFMVYG